MRNVQEWDESNLPDQSNSQRHLMPSQNYDNSLSEYSHLQVMFRLQNNVSNKNQINDSSNFDSSVSQLQIMQVNMPLLFYF